MISNGYVQYGLQCHKNINAGLKARIMNGVMKGMDCLLVPKNQNIDVFHTLVNIFTLKKKHFELEQELTTKIAVVTIPRALHKWLYIGRETALQGTNSYVTSVLFEE